MDKIRTNRRNTDKWTKSGQMDEKWTNGRKVDKWTIISQETEEEEKSNS